MLYSMGVFNFIYTLTKAKSVGATVAKIISANIILSYKRYFGNILESKGVSVTKKRRINEY